MSLHERYSNEADFREKFVRPLLNRLGFYGVSEQHGSQAYGKDFVFSELHRLGGMRNYAAQVKHEPRISQGSAVESPLRQVREAFAVPFRRLDSPRECHVSCVYVFNSGDITDNARTVISSALSKDNYGDNVHFLDGKLLESLNEWSIFQTGDRARSRLLALRSTLRMILVNLKDKVDSNETLCPTYIPGLDLYLSEPVEFDVKFHGELIKLWAVLQSIETIRLQYPPGSKSAQQLLPIIKDLAEKAVPDLEVLTRKVELAFEKLRPLSRE
jgi:hypothetical protein